jgi:flagellar hook-length control protein FliK
MDDMLLKMISATSTRKTVEKAMPSTDPKSLATDDGFDFGSLMQENTRLHDQNMEQPRREDTPEREDAPAIEKTEREPVRSEREEEPRDVQETDEPRDVEKNEAEETSSSEGEEQNDDAPADEQTTGEETTDTTETTESVNAETAQAELAIVDEAIAAGKDSTAEIDIQSDKGVKVETTQQVVTEETVTTDAQKVNIEAKGVETDKAEKVDTKATAETVKAETPKAVDAKPTVEAKVDTENKTENTKVAVDAQEVEKAAEASGTKVEKVNTQQIEATPDEVVAEVKTEAPKAQVAEVTQKSEQKGEQKIAADSPIATMQGMTATKSDSAKTKADTRQAERKIAEEVLEEKPVAELIVPKANARKSVHNTIKQTTPQTFVEALNAVGTLHAMPQASDVALGQANANSAVVRAEAELPIQSFDQSHFLDNVMRQARMIQRPDGSSEMNLNLRPAELGSVIVKLTMRNDQLTARLQVDSAVVREVVQNLMERVRESLAGEGIDLDSCDIDLRQEAEPDMREEMEAEGEEDASAEANATQKTTKGQSRRLGAAPLSSASNQMNFVA